MISYRLGRLFAVGNQRVVWLEPSFGRGEAVAPFRRWPAAVAVAAGCHTTLEISVDAGHVRLPPSIAHCFCHPEPAKDPLSRPEEYGSFVVPPQDDTLTQLCRHPERIRRR